MADFKIYKNKEDYNNEDIKKYFEHYLFLYGEVGYILDNNINNLIYTINDIFKLRLLSYYEKCILNDAKIPYNYIIKENNIYLDKLKNELKNVKSDLTTYQQNMIYELNKLINDNNSNIINVPFYNFIYFERLMELRNQNQIDIFNYIKDCFNLSLGTKNPSVSLKRNKNFEIAKLYYDIFTSQSLKEELNALVNNREKCMNLSSEINKLNLLVDEISISEFNNYCKHNNIYIETLLLLYIINYLSYKVDIELIENFYNEEKLYFISLEADANVDTNLKGLAIKNVIEPKLKLLQLLKK